jgi:hypothetical protein
MALLGVIELDEMELDESATVVRLAVDPMPAGPTLSRASGPSAPPSQRRSRSFKS